MVSGQARVLANIRHLQREAQVKLTIGQIGILRDILRQGQTIIVFVMLQVSSEQHCMLHNTAAGNNKNWCPLQTAGQLTGLYAARSTHCMQTETSVSQGEIIRRSHLE